MSLDPLPQGLVKPTPMHALTPAAEWGRERFRLERAANRRRTFSLGDLPPGASKKTKRKRLPLVTVIPQPWDRIDLAALPSAAASFARWAQGQGYLVFARSSGQDRYEVALGDESRIGPQGLPILVCVARWSRIGASGQRLVGYTSKGVVMQGRVVAATAARAALTR